MPEPAASNSAAVARFAAGMRGCRLPAEVEDAARLCLADWMGVAIGAHAEGAAAAVRRVAARWGGRGDAQILLGATTNPAAAALVNGTLAHCLDFDDTHVGSVAHLSAPTWAASLAVGTHRGLAAKDMLAAFVAGFEAGARIGGGGFGEALNQRLIHSTAVVGGLAAATAASTLMGLAEGAIENALGAAATQAGGLTGSFGTMAKPFHAGHAAFSGILAAELAAEGFEPARSLLDGRGGLAEALVQDGGAAIGPLDFASGWELLRNTYKPYASCLLTHPVIDACRAASARLDGAAIERATVVVHPLTIRLAARTAPKEPLEGKFSTAFCAALALTGHAVGAGDFTPERLADPALQGLAARIELESSPTMPKTAAALCLFTADGRRLESEIAVARGNPENPIGWDDTERKFTGLVEPVLGAAAAELFRRLRSFSSDADVAAVRMLVARRD